LEAGQALGLVVDLLETVHRGSLGPAAEEGCERVDVLGSALEDGLNRPVGPVADPACDAARVGQPPRRVAEEDALDAAMGDQMAAAQ
jgi:hypothetical protein